MISHCNNTGTNVTANTAFVGGVAAKVWFDDIKDSGNPSVSSYTGGISSVTVQSTTGITAANFNTGVASQANNISLNAQVSNP